MYYFTKWDVLIVDDEPDVLALSKLAMEDFEVYGLPLALHTAQTGAQAIELLHESIDLSTNLALAFVDVVMETDSAGLDLCNHIREDIGNRLTQIFIRTGQPGLAPERSVIDQYEINGYFTKVEATEDKLYSLVKSGVRQFLWSHMTQTYMASLNEIMRAQQWRPKIARVLNTLAETAPGVLADTSLYIAFDDEPLVQQGWDDQQVAQWQKSVGDSTGMRLTLTGNQYVRDAGNCWGIRIVPGPTNAGALLLCQTAFAPPEDLVAMTHDFLQNLAILWKHAAP